jgi:hypothetical protein
MSDIANAIYKHLQTMAPHQLERLTAIQLKEAADEIARLTLTGEERAAVRYFAHIQPHSKDMTQRHAATLCGLLDRLK